MTPRSTAQALLDLLHRCFHLTRRGRRPEGAPPGQGRLLRTLAENGPMGGRELAELLQIRPASLSDLVRKAEGNGFVARAKDPQDGRRMLFSLTEAGRVRVAEKQQAYDQRLDRIFSALDEQEQQTLLSLLQKLCDAAAHTPKP